MLPMPPSTAIANTRPMYARFIDQLDEGPI
jgi:hypothetical protein